MNNLGIHKLKIVHQLQTLCLSSGECGGGSQNIFVRTAKARNCQTNELLFGADILNEYFGNNSKDCSNRFSYLITGDPGFGKTFLARHIFATLLEKWSNGGKCLPIYINLPLVVNTFRDEEKQEVNLTLILKTQLELVNLVKADIEGWNLILILDGYDECNVAIQNFGDSQVMENAIPFSVIIFSRPDSLPAKFNLRESFFGLGKLFTDSTYLEFELIPFSFLEVEEYVRQFCEVGHSMISKDTPWDAAEYISWLKIIPDLQEISGTPLLLSLILPALPKIVRTYSDTGNDHSKIRQICSTQTGIFDEFTQQWFEYQSKRNQNTNLLSAYHFQRYCRIYSQNLATLLIDNQGFLKEGSWTLEETLDLSLLEPVKDSHLMANWSSSKKMFAENVSIVKEIKDSCLLSYSNNSYHFFHRSIAEYFAAKEISENLVWSFNIHINGKEISHGGLADKKFGSVSKVNFSSSLLEKLGDKVKSSPEFEDLLLLIIKKSAEIAGLGDLASKCLTILNAAQYNFSGMDFQDIIVPYANMKQSFCAKTDFRGANLQGVEFTRSYLVNARFEGANLRNANFGEELQVTVPPCKNSIFSNDDKLSCYRTGSGNVNLFFKYSKVMRRRPGKIMNRNDEIIAHEMNFDTGVTTKSFSLGRSALSDLNYHIISDKLTLVTWAHAVPQPSSLEEFDIKIWDLSMGRNVKTVSIADWFTCPNNLVFTKELIFDLKGKWVAMKTGQYILVKGFVDFSRQLNYSFSKNIKIHGFILGPRNDILAIFTSENIHILELAIENSVVVVINEDKLEHPCYDLYTSLNTFDNLCQFMVFGGDVGPKILKLYNRATKKLTILKGQSLLIKSVSFNYDSTLLAVGDTYSNILIWNVNNGQIVQMFSRDANKSVHVCFHLEKNLLACSMMDDPLIKFWKVGNIEEDHFEDGDKNPSISQGNVGYISSTSDARFVATLNVSAIHHNESCGEPDVRELTLNIWKLEENKSFLLKPNSVKVGQFLGPGTAFKISPNQKCIVVGTLLTESDDTSNPLLYKDCLPEHVALIYDLSANLISKFFVEHDIWKGLKTLNYRSALFFETNCANNHKSNLATALWDGSIQLWNFSDPAFVKKIVLESPGEILSLERSRYKYVDPINTLAFRKLLKDTDQFWIHIGYLTFSDCGNWILCVISDPDKIIVIWNLQEDYNKSIPERVQVIKVKTNRIPTRPLALEFNSQVQNLFWVNLQDFQVIHVRKNKRDYRVLFTDRELEMNSAKMYEPFNWLICGDRNGVLRIWTVSNDLILEIPFWFPIYALTASKLDDFTVNIFIGGFYKNLIGIRVSKNLNWELFRVFQAQKFNLVAQDCNISQSLQVTEWSKRILKGLRAKGQPAHLRQEYYSFHQLFRELPGTASSLPTPSLVNSNESTLMREISADNNIWIVSVVAKTPKTKFQKTLKVFGIQHLFIVLEGSINLRKFAIRADLRQEPTTGNVIYVLTTYQSFTQFSEDMKNCEGRRWEISPKWGRNLIRNIRRDQQLVWTYDFLLHNCISWCHAHLIRVGVPLTYQQMLFHNSVLKSLFNTKMSYFIFIALLALLINYIFSIFSKELLL